MNTEQLTPLLAVAVEAARRGAAELEAWRDRFRIREKAPADLVTDADTASQRAVREHLLGHFPEHRFLGEEDCSGRSIDELRPLPDDPPTWVCDPLDGTCNYAHGVPAYAVNIALWHEGQTQLGVTFDPRMNELYTAARGSGAFLNGEPIRVSTVASLKQALLVTGFPADYDRQRHNLAAWDRLARVTQSLRRTGSTALNMAYVAAGRFDGYWCFDNWPWDVLPGGLLIQEAGGRITNAAGGPFDPFRMDILATNSLIHDAALHTLRS